MLYFTIELSSSSRYAISMIIKLLLCAFSPLIIYFLAVTLFSRKVPVLTALFWILGGMLAVVPAVIIQFLLFTVETRLTGFSSIAFNSFITSSAAEECSKLLLCFLLARNWYRRHGSAGVMGENDGVLSPLLASVMTGLAFGGFESVVYGIAAASVSVTYIRICTAVLLHGACCILHSSAIFAKYGYGRAGAAGWYVTPLFAWSFHGIYNMMLQTGGKRFETLAVSVLGAIILFAVYSARETTARINKN